MVDGARIFLAYILVLIFISVDSAKGGKGISLFQIKYCSKLCNITSHIRTMAFDTLFQRSILNIRGIVAIASWIVRLEPILQLKLQRQHV